MKGELDFNQIDGIGEYLEVSDYDVFISLLATLKEFFDEKTRVDSLQK